MSKKLYFNIYVRVMLEKEPFYVSDGIIYVQDNLFEGYMTNDYISGSFEEKMLYVEMLKYSYDENICEYGEFNSNIVFFETPQTYVVKDLDSQLELELNIQEKITDISEIEEIKETLKRIKKFYGIPDNMN